MIRCPLGYGKGQLFGIITIRIDCGDCGIEITNV